MLTQVRLKEVLHYDPETGAWTWLVDCSNRKAGTLAGCLNRQLGYWVIGVDGTRYYSHRLAVFYMTGGWPETADHKQVGFKHRSDCRWGSIRPATHTQNKANVGRLRNNTSGFKGVSRHKQSGRWRADSSVGDKQVHLGLFDTPEEAYKAYISFVTTQHGEFART